MQIRRLGNSIRFFTDQPPWVVVTFGAVFLGLVSYLDWVTIPDLSFAVFYILPVAFVTWFAGRRIGSLMALASAMGWLTADLGGGTHYVHPSIVYLNALTRFGFFLVIVVLLSAWKTTGRRLETTVQDRTAALRDEIREHARARQANQQLAAHLGAAEDAERRRIAYDIHDGLGQMLSLVKLNVEAALSTVADSPGTSSRRQRLIEAVGMVDVLIRQTRTLIFDLHPAMLDDLGLAPTLHWYGEQFGQQTGADVAISEQGDARALTPATSHYLFRAVKELLNNALKHGRAKEIIVALHWQSDTLRIVIDDDGSGFDAAAIEPGTQPGLGLPGIRERLEALGGKLRIESRSAEGARVILEAPLRDPGLTAIAASSIAT